eukprot:1180362-Prorocentrum_minimum.AAC.5
MKRLSGSASPSSGPPTPEDMRDCRMGEVSQYRVPSTSFLKADGFIPPIPRAGIADLGLGGGLC